MPTNRIVFLNQPGPGGGGGGGGNKSIEPPRLAQDIGRDKLTVPVTKPPDIQPVKSPEDELPKMDFNIPAKAMASAEQTPGRGDRRHEVVQFHHRSGVRAAAAGLAPAPGPASGRDRAPGLGPVGAADSAAGPTGRGPGSNCRACSGK